MRNEPMRTSPDGIEAIRQAEGTRRNPTTGRHIIYADPAGILTIGFGHSLTPAEIRNNTFGNGITEEQATDLLAQDLATAENAVNQNVRVPLNQNQFDALSGFTFNIGGRRF